MSDLIGRTLGHYRIVAKIGEGGMGEVYGAHDERLDRDVAIKVLPVEVADNPDRLERFEREAKAVAKLDHPNILAIHDFATEGGVTYAVMELLAGQDLRHSIPESGMPWRKAVEVAAAIADGLAAAHGKGVIHRDLKPENVFITSDGRVKVLDFGLARMKEPADEAAETATLTPAGTAAGTVMGTLGYMSPEQLRGEAADARSDIFALGCVLYEMLSGRPVFLRGSTAETTAAILREEPQHLADSGVTLPVELERSVRRCLEKSPEARFQSASDLAFALRSMSADQAIRAAPSDEVKPRPRRRLGLWLAVAAATLVMASAAVWFYQTGSVEEATAETVPRIAVLPFENLGPPEDEYFADGMTDEVRGRLFSLGNLEVIARYSSDQFRGTEKPLSQIGEELGARYLLTAKVRWQKADDGSSRIRVSPELVEVQPNTAPVAMWSDAFDATLADVFQVQTDIATRVAHALDVRLSADEEQALESRPTDNLAAYDAFLRAEQIAREGAGTWPVRFSRMAELYKKAVALDPEFALAWAKLAILETGNWAFEDVQRVETVRQAAQRAIELDPSLPEARRAMASYLLVVENNPEGADEQIALGLEMAPNNSELRAWRVNNSQLPIEDRLRYWERAAELDPLSWRAASRAGWFSLFARRYRKAQDWYDRAISLAAPTNVEMVTLRAMVFLAQGDIEGARTFIREAAERVDVTELVAGLAVYYQLYWVLDDEWQELLFRLGPEAFGGDSGERSLAFAHTHYLRGEWDQVRADAENARAEFAQKLESLPDSFFVNLRLGLALAYLGRGDEALAHCRRALELVPDNFYFEPYFQLQLVRVHLILGQPEAALDVLEPLLEVPFYLSPGWLGIDPLFDPLRDNPRFQTLLEDGHVKD
jgi:serine/threonine protein kinase/tetratricopeptide (TPR) repeat protein